MFYGCMTVFEVFIKPEEKDEFMKLIEENKLFIKERYNDVNRWTIIVRCPKEKRNILLNWLEEKGY